MIIVDKGICGRTHMYLLRYNRVAQVALHYLLVACWLQFKGVRTFKVLCCCNGDNLFVPSELLVDRIYMFVRLRFCILFLSAHSLGRELVKCEIIHVGHGRDRTWRNGRVVLDTVSQTLGRPNLVQLYRTSFFAPTGVASDSLVGRERWILL